MGPSAVFYVFFDTTALHNAYRLRGSLWDSIQLAVERNVALVATSDISVKELERQAQSDAQFIEDRLADVKRDAERHYVEVPVTPIPFDKDEWNSRFADRLDERHIDVVPRVDPSHDLLLARDFGEMPPFKKNGEGYRDTLIWLTFLDWIQAKPLPDDVTLFVSNNSLQFAKDRKKDNPLDPELVSEFGNVADGTVSLIATLEKLVTEIRPASLAAINEASEENNPSPSNPSGQKSSSGQQDSVSEQEGAASEKQDTTTEHKDTALDHEESESGAVEDSSTVEDDPEFDDLTQEGFESGESMALAAAQAGVAGFNDSSVDFSSSNPTFAGVVLENAPRDFGLIDDASVTNLEIIEDRDEASLVDRFDETTELWSVTVEVDAEVEGFVHKSDFVSLPEGSVILDGDWNDHYMWVSASLSFALRFDVRVEISGDVTPELVGASVLGVL